MRLPDAAAAPSRAGMTSSPAPDAPPGGTGVSIDEVGMAFDSGEVVTEAISSVSGRIADGRFVSVIGPSGCGKSTLLDIVGGLLPPTRGRVTIAGEEVRGPRRDTAMVFQEDSTLHWRTVTENVTFGLEVAGVGRAERAHRAQEMIELVGLPGFERHRPRQLSGGMKQRVAIARALVLDPRILLMDEPFGALDQQTRMFIGLELLRIWEEARKSVLFVTHDIQEAVFLADEVWVMSHRPSVIKEVLPVDLGRPRDSEVLKDRRFHEHTSHLWGLLSEEASAGLGGERERS
jgi:NitT/TauT family transport system ATP-binding protein